MLTPGPLVDDHRAALKTAWLDLYGHHAVGHRSWLELQALLDQAGQRQSGQGSRAVQAGEAILIAYPDHIVGAGPSTLHSLAEYCGQHFSDLFSALHVLPFFEADGDFGFAVLDHTRIDPRFGDEAAVRALATRWQLCCDLVLNHVSVNHAWVKAAQGGDLAALARLIVIGAPDSGTPEDPVHSSSLPTTGAKHLKVWTRYGPRQVDLNFRHPEVLVDMVRVMLWQVALGARWIRLDAVAFIWKEAGSDSCHRPQVLQVLALLRYVLRVVAPDVRLIAEVDMESRGSEYLDATGGLADAAYDFALPALLAHAFISGQALDLLHHLVSRTAIPAGCTCLNAAATHDGLFLRPYLPVLTAQAQTQLVARAHLRGGTVRLRPVNGQPRPYECNVALASLLAEADDTPEILGRRIGCLVTITCAVPGTPAIYLNVLLCAPNDPDLAQSAGDCRGINRRTFLATDAAVQMHEGGAPRTVVEHLAGALRARRDCAAFEPHAPLLHAEVEIPGVLAFWRGDQEVLCLHNLCGSERSYPAPPRMYRDLLTGHHVTGTVVLAPYQCAWLVASTAIGNGRILVGHAAPTPPHLLTYYSEHSWQAQPTVGLTLDESYRRNHLPLVAPQHVDAVHSCSTTDYVHGRYAQERISVVALMPDSLFHTPAMTSWLTAMRRAPFAHKVAWAMHERRLHRLHATVSGRLNLRLSPDQIEEAVDALAVLHAFAVRALGPWLGRHRNNGRLYLPLAPIHSTRQTVNPLYEAQRMLGQSPTDLFVLGLLQFTDHLTPAEASHLVAILTEYAGVGVFDAYIDELAVIATHDDLILDSVVRRRIRLQPGSRQVE